MPLGDMSFMERFASELKFIPPSVFTSLYVYSFEEGSLYSSPELTDCPALNTQTGDPAACLYKNRE